MIQRLTKVGALKLDDIKKVREKGLKGKKKGGRHRRWEVKFRWKLNHIWTCCYSIWLVFPWQSKAKDACVNFLPLKYLNISLQRR